MKQVKTIIAIVGTFITLWILFTFIISFLYHSIGGTELEAGGVVVASGLLSATVCVVIGIGLTPDK